MILLTALLAMAGVILLIRALSISFINASTLRLPERLMLLVAILAAVGAGLWVSYMPMYHSATSYSNGISYERVVPSSGISDIYTVMLLLIPAVIATIPLVIPRNRTRIITEATLAILFAAFVIIAGFSIGGFYLPTTISLLIAAFFAQKKLETQVETKFA